MKSATRVIMFTACLAAALLAGTWLQASQAGTTGDLEAVFQRHRVDRSEALEISRAWRGAINVGINARRLEAIIDTALGGEMEVRYLVRALSLTTSTALNGLPAGPMLNKFSEGLAKNVKDRDLVEALENRALSLKKARQILSVLIYDEKPLGGLDMVIMAVSGALERGVDERNIETIFREEGPDLKKVVLEIENLK